MSIMQTKECHISDCEDNDDESEWDLSNTYESSSENDEASSDEHKDHYFDPTKITTSLPLLPFNNQVGGHASFFRFSKRAICKPVSSREQEFYEHIDAKHHELLPFTSQYMGVLNVTYRSTGTAEPPVPEVLFEKNKHLLRDWHACANNLGRRHSSSCSPGSHPSQDYLRPSICRARSKKFQEQVLREVFSPEALKERLVLAEDWKRRNRLPSNASSGNLEELKSCWDSTQPELAHSYSDRFPVRKLWRDENPIAEGGRSVPIMSTCQHHQPAEDDFDEDDDSSTLTDSIDTMTLEPRRPSFISSTASSPSIKKESPGESVDDDNIFTMDDFDVGKRPHLDTMKRAPPNIPLLQVDSTCLKKQNNKQRDCATSDTNAKRLNNPWSLQIYNRDLQKIRNRKQTNAADEPQQTMQKYILIEDLTDDVKYPCVLDLKMGTRQYGVYATREKMRSQTIKCEKSTSKVLGVRVCGMQVYKTNLREFLFQDKYYGRTLTPISFCHTLEAYLDNGNGCQIKHIPVIVRKLRRLARIVKTMNDYRFYSSSLLMIYDGNASSDRKIDVRIIDFANCVTSEDVQCQYQNFTYPPRNKGPDNGYLLGLKSLVLCFERIFAKHGGSAQDLFTEGDDVFQDIYETANDEAIASIMQQ
ncbi:Vacuolar protein sorting-associated protein 55 [Mucor velutinosus]|uniref:Kinase n=1 Tax=Mucor velutinosus TaxID=708070 RepID=A0AAN7DDB9_9FUNG|nr:Vacuolar protein sorting-associated protein 55 [Mucor velutinosus]